MRGKLVVTFLAGLVVGAVVAFAGWHPRALGQPAPQAQKWEYKVVRVGLSSNDDEDTRMMNALAAEGWEYSGLLAAGDRASMVTFKRLKK
jgi:hypothetical protein